MGPTGSGEWRGEFRRSDERRGGGLRAAVIGGALLGGALLGGAIAPPAAWAAAPSLLSPGLPSAAVLVARPDPGRVLHLAFALPLRDPAGLDALLAHITDPADPAFRQTISAAEFTARFAPSAADHDTVRAALQRAGFTLAPALPTRMVIEAAAPVEVIEKALHVRLGLYRHPTENRLYLAPDRQPSFDAGAPVLRISGLEDFIRPVAHLIRGGMMAVPAVSTGSGPHGQFIGSDVRAAYYGSGKLTGRDQSVGLLEFGGYNIADVQTYFTETGAPLAVPIHGVALDGQNLFCGPGCDDSEQALDIEEAISMAPALDRIVYYDGSNAISMLARMASDDSCAVLSSSWGWSPDAELDEPVFKEFAVQGQSFVDASGDDGFLLKKGVVWPADDAYVTGVGGTDLVTAGPAGPWASETGWRFSGGGPSPDRIGIPAEQRPFVTAANAGSLVSRNVPDIAGDADTDNFSCYDGGCSSGNGGTSYAAPLWAGFLALANEASAQAGTGRIGFLNPLLYASPPTVARPLHDQVSGSNGKYSATPGYDLVTGFGSPVGDQTIGALVHAGGAAP